MRKAETVQVPIFPGTQDRDKGKLFKITEWPAHRAEKWGLRMVMALNRESGQLPMEVRGIGWEGVAVLGINTFLRGKVDPEQLVPLLDELLECVEIVRDRRAPDVATPLVSDDDIEEVATRMWLRSEVLRVHTGFSPADALSALFSSIMTKRSPEA